MTTVEISLNATSRGNWILNLGGESFAGSDDDDLRVVIHALEAAEAAGETVVRPAGYSSIAVACPEVLTAALALSRECMPQIERKKRIERTATI
ncbi:hypothetical protein [Mycobacterium aquaticum]|uniref:Uncharacterized protein n=1 Tax=Mycobacterium aquaticum TaxID=1927124 RepID=A0A1X0ABI0_9MYCO|nr:hypothetical protein [Mycobacterium aquaticum]ORA27394.1 hypothetical protein BST13_30520 [Mycobacterium aquaticum]